MPSKPPCVMPQYWYAGSKKWGIPSDVKGIAFHLMRLPERLRQHACDKYDEIFLRNVDGKFPNDRRTMANEWLLKFCDENGISIEAAKNKLSPPKISKEAQSKANNLAAKMKKAMHRKTILEMAEGKER